MKLIQPPEKSPVNILLVGPYKSGKTVGAATLPGGVLYNNFDQPNSTRLIHRLWPDGRIMEPELPPYEEGKRNLFAHMIEVADTVADPKQDVFEGVVVDTVGELYRRLMEETSRKSIRPTLPTYGEVSAYVERWCRALVEAPVNTVLICHELLQQNGEELVSVPYTGTKAGSADLGGRLAQMVDIVAHTGFVQHDDGTKQYMAQLIPGRGRQAGERYAGVLGDYRSLNIAEWITVIEEAEGAILSGANVGTNANDDEPAEREAA